MPHPYLRLLADRRLRRLAAGDLLSLVGDGMAVVAIPWEALHLAHLRGVSEGLAVSASASAYVLVGVPLALTTGLGRYRPDRGGRCWPTVRCAARCSCLSEH